MVHILISLGFLMLIIIARLEAFSYHETINVVKKSFEESDYKLGPEFDQRGSFAYLQVKELGTIPPAIRVDLKIFDNRSSEVIQSNKTFDADADSTSISVTSIQLDPIILTVNEQKTNGENKTILVHWEPLVYPDPNLYLPVNYTIPNKGSYSRFDILINDHAICDHPNDMCRIEFNGYKNEKLGVKRFFNGDLVWSSMHISYVASTYLGVFFIRGFDTIGNYKLMYCNTLKNKDCSELLSLPNAKSVVHRVTDAISYRKGFCFTANPDEDTSVSCLIFDMEYEGKVILNRTVNYKERMFMLEMIVAYDEVDNPEMIVVANKHHCIGIDCLNVIINKIPFDSAKPIGHRDLTLKCSSQEKLFKVSIRKDKFIKALVIDYICEGNEDFTFKSATIDDKRIR